jgi:hypothetical protein
MEGFRNVKVKSDMNLVVTRAGPSVMGLDISILTSVDGRLSKATLHRNWCVSLYFPAVDGVSVGLTP